MSNSKRKQGPVPGSTTGEPKSQEVYSALMQEIEARTAVVGVIGLGYVGLPLASAFVRGGFRVLGFDSDPSKIVRLGKGETYIEHLGAQLVPDMQASGRFEATCDSERLGEADAVLICVPTPLGAEREPDLSFVRRCAHAIASSLRTGQLIVLESTTYPGTTRDVLLPILSASKLKAEQDFFTAYSPERQDPGRVAEGNPQQIPKLVGGTSQASGQLAAALYGAILDRVVSVSSSEVAEAAKLLENVFRSVNIALVNELKVILDAMGIDVWEVIEAASTKPFGFMRFDPGPGLGGHCIPVDPFYLSWAARKSGHRTKFVELAGEINRGMPEYVIHRTLLALNEQGRTLRDAHILLLGLAYKADVDDVRESPAVRLIERFQELGAQVRYCDPHVPVPPPMRDHDLSAYRSVELTPQELEHADCIVVATAHSATDWDLVAEHASLVVDTRNALSSRMEGRSHYVRA